MNNSLAGCVSSLRISTETLQSSINTIDQAVADYPRLAKVLQNYRHFELTSNADILEAQNALSSEIGPEVEKLLTVTEQYIAKLERKEKGLVSKAELQEGRLTNYKSRVVADGAIGGGTGVNTTSSTAATGGRGKAGNNEENREKLKMLKAKKQRVLYAVERLEMEAKQKQRQLKNMGLEDD